MNGTRHRARYNIQLMVKDMALLGWNNAALARAAGVSTMTVSRFLRGTRQTAPTADCLSRALGRPVRRYFSHVEAVAS